MSQGYISLPQQPQSQYPPQPGYQPPMQGGYNYSNQGGYQQPQPQVVGYQQPPTVQGYQPPQTVGGYSNQPFQAQGYANQPVPQPGVVPYFGGIQFVYVVDPLAELALSTGVLIRQQVQIGEQITGCESPNRYFVFSQSPQAGMKLLFKCKESSDWCMRNCCSADSREFNMAIKHVTSENILSQDFARPYLDIRKPFKCTCCCLDRPEMLINFGEDGTTLGRIKQPYTCCDPWFTIYNSTGQKIYTIYGDCCQCGLICKNNFCGKLSEVVFDIHQGDSIHSNRVGSIIKKSATGAELITSADSYQINFPPQARPEEKLLIIVAGLMIDYQFFEESASSNDNNNTHNY